MVVSWAKIEENVYDIYIYLISRIKSEISFFDKLIYKGCLPLIWKVKGETNSKAVISNSKNLLSLIKEIDSDYILKEYDIDVEENRELLGKRKMENLKDI